MSVITLRSGKELPQQQTVPKKLGMILVKNQNNELIPSRRVCINYRKLNQETYKDHLLFPFFDQVLEKLESYMKIHIALIDQHKTTFTYLFGTFAYNKMSCSLCNAPSTF
ncbi:hypothetical protein CR513_42416, partial [Mucuna pruriens]